MGRSMREVWPEAWEFNAPIFERVMARGESVTVEDQLFRIAQGGEQQDAYFTFSCSPIRSHVGQVVATMVVLLETKQHEARYRSIVEQSSDGIFVADSHGQFVEANPAACQLLGRTASDVLGSTIASVVADSAKIPLRFPELLQGKTIVGERQVVRSDGTRVSVELSARRMSDGRFLGIVRDLTERKRAEELLRDGQDRLRAILDTVGDPIFVKDNDHRIILANRAFGEIFCMDVDAVIGKTLAEHVPPHERQYFLEVDRRVLDTGISDVCEETLTVGNVTRTIVTRKTRLIDASGNKYLVGSIHDITERQRAEETLRESDARYRSLVDGVPGIVYVFSSLRGGLFYSPRAADILGYSPQQLLANPRLWHDAVHPVDLPLVERSIAGAMAGTPFAIEYRIRDAHGHWHWLDDRSTQCATRNDETVIEGFALDITERKRTEAALSASESRHAAMAANISDVIGIIGVDGVMQYKSPNIEKHFGWKPSDLVGTDGWLTVHPDDLARIQQEFSTLLEVDHASATVTYRYKCKDGHYTPVELTATNLTKDPHISGVLLNYHDIKERLQAATQLAQSHLLLSNLARLVPGVIYQYRLYPDGRSAFPYSSPGMNDIYEVTSDEVREDATPVFGRLHSEDYDDVANAIQESGRTLGMFSCEFRVVLPRQGLRWRWSQAQPERMDDGGTLWHGIILDITESKRAEEERAVLEAQLQQAQKMESVGRLAGGVAHDFNNMLAVIIGHAEMAMDQVDSAQPLHASLDEIYKAASRSADLTQQLLAFARKQTVTQHVIDVNQTVADELSMLGRLIGEDIRLVWRPGADLWPVKIDPSQLDQMLANLCVNARDAIDEGGTITIATRNDACDAGAAGALGIAPGDYVVVEVADDGCGMDAETLSHIFEPFFTTKGVGKGTGLGLASVYGAVRQNGGFIDSRSTPDVGTTFTIYLPRTRDAAKRVGSVGDPEPLTRGHETILLVEDEPAVLNLTMKILTRQGYDVIAARSPGEAIRLADEHAGRIHLLITDVVMPEMNGRTLAKRVLSARPEVKCLFMSGYTADVIAHHGVMDAGVSFLQKPFLTADLATKVRETLDRE